MQLDLRGFGYRGRDGSGTGLGLKWDFIIIHESGHEWFGNNITTKDLADMYVHEGYTKGGNMLHAIRHSMDDDERFRQILRGMNKTFYHQTVTTQQIENYLSQQAGYNYEKVFDQYLRTTQIPDLEFYFSDDHKKVFYRWTNCVNGFDLPLVLKSDKAKMRVIPTEQWALSSVLTSVLL